MTDVRLKDLLRKSKWSIFSLPIRFRIAALFLWLQSPLLLKWYLGIEYVTFGKNSNKVA